MKVVKITAIVLVVGYVGIVVAFESFLGYTQPQFPNTIVITTVDDAGDKHDRVVSELESNGHYYVAVNHWPRAWYYRILDNPDVTVTTERETGDYTAVEVMGSEHDQVQSDNPTSLGFRILTGFPPRYFIRLDPRT